MPMTLNLLHPFWSARAARNGWHPDAYVYEVKGHLDTHKDTLRNVHEWLDASTCPEDRALRQASFDDAERLLSQVINGIGPLRHEPHVGYDWSVDRHYFIWKEDENGRCLLVSRWPMP